MAARIYLTAQPDRSSPVAVATKDVRVALSWNIVDTVLLAANLHHKRILLVDLGEGADAVGREKLVLVQEVLENTSESLL